MGAFLQSVPRWESELSTPRIGRGQRRASYSTRRASPISRIPHAQVESGIPHVQLGPTQKGPITAPRSACRIESSQRILLTDSLEEVPRGGDSQEIVIGDEGDRGSAGL